MLVFVSASPRIVEGAEVLALLQSLARRHAWVEVATRAGPVGRGILEDVNQDSEVLVVLQTGLRDPNLLRELEAEALIEAAIEGVVVRVTSRLRRAIDAGGARHFRFHAPSLVTRLQRRAYFRVPMKPGSELAVPQAEGRILLPLVDVSAGGVCALLAEPPALTEGTMLPAVQLLIPGEDAFALPAVVRYLQPVTGQSARYRCGIELLPGREVERDRLYRVVAKRERELLGKRQHPRASLPGWVMLSGDGARARVRQLIDVSAGGLSFELEQGDGDLAAGTELRSVEIRVAAEEPFTCAGVVRRLLKTGTGTSCGVELKALSTEDRERLDQLVRYAVSLKR